jgi:hypothetical protein
MDPSIRLLPDQTEIEEETIQITHDLKFSDATYLE